MSPDPTSSFDQRLHDAAARAEQELRRFGRYLDDEVVPEVRRNGSTALRAAAVHLQKLADSIDAARSAADAKAGQGSSSSSASGPNSNSTGS